MLRERPAVDAQPLLSAELSYNLHDIMVEVTGLPPAGVVLKADGLTPVVLGDALTAAELAALSFAPTSLRSEEVPAGNGLVIYVPQDCGRLPIALFADLAAGTAADTPVVITELPSNGSVFLADGMTAVVRGQKIIAAQLCGLTFRPAADAVGQISLLRYRSPDQQLVGEVLLVVGPPLPSIGSRATAATCDDSSLSPIAVALLLEAGLSSLSATQASATVTSNDLLPPDSSAPSDAMVGIARQISGRATGFLPDHTVPNHIVPASAILAKTAPTAIDTTGPAETDTSKPHHHIGSSSPMDFGSLKLVPLSQSTTLTSTSVPGSFEIANDAVLEIKGPSGKNVIFDTGSGELIIDHPAQFRGLIGSSSPSTPLSPNDLIDLKDLPFTSSMSASVQYDSAANISTVDFSNGSKTVTLQFSGQDLNWTFKSDGQGGTIVADPPTNPIVLENQKPGTPQSVWQIDPGQDSTTIQGFTTAISTNIGGTVQFKINNHTSNPNYHIDIYRLGYYGGDGARLITTLQHQASSSVNQPAPLTNPATGEVDAGDWSVTDSWSVPTSAVSGVYIANVIDGNQVFQIPFVIRNDGSQSAIVFQTSDQTWQAYNPWGGANLYAGNGPGVNGSAYAVSYNRPITTRDAGLSGTSNDMVFSAEYPAIFWLEQNGYDVSYISGMDAATNGALLLNHKVYMDVGHDEYWTDSQVANVQAAGNAGVSLMFLSGNEVYWQTRFAPSIDPSATPNRTLISYKDTHANTLIDPSGTATGTFMDARFASTGGMSGIPSNALTGTVFQVDGAPDRTDIITIPYGDTLLRFWRNTAVAQTTPGNSASLVQNLLGYEWDSSPNNGFRPAGLVDLSSTTLQVGTYLLDYGNNVGNGTATHNLVEFRNPQSGALVFGAGTVFWSWGLASDHDQVAGSTTPTDPKVQQATVNMLADMGVQPATLQASLVIAQASTDHTAPTSSITSLSSTSVVEGQSITLTGTASDVGGVIGGVEVSTDGGKTWHPATSNVGTTNVNWSYTFATGAPGTLTVETRAVDDSLNLETPSDGTTYKVKPASNLTIFSPTDTPALVTNNDPNSVELGVKFVSAASGDITGIRFYKGPQNTGTHLGDLWTSNGTLLASATFTNETASGWQQVNFATPVHIQAGVTYIASYHTTTGQYSTTDYYFDNTGHTNGALTATGSGLNGLYAYGNGPNFPSNVSIIKGDNYWVDVVFNDTSFLPQANNDSGFSVTENGVLNIAASALLANDTDPAGLPFSISSVSSPLNGTVSYNAQTQTVTFTPNAGYAGPADFNYAITDSSGATGTGQVALNVVYPITAQSLFGTNDTPSVTDSGDSNSTEVGVKFTASVSGAITGIRFYKGSGNTGPHVAHLWSSAGTLLATATFVGETASGWQEVNFSTPVLVTAGTTYVASYHTNGDYSASQNYFASQVTNGELTAPATSNGLYGYGSGAVFPTNTYKSTNYWVDVVFDGSNRPIANADGGFVVNENGSISIATSALLANDSDTGGFAISFTGVSNPVNGTVSYNPNTQQVTFVPSAGYTGTASFTYTIGDTNGGTNSAAVSLFVNDPSAETLFSLSSTPSVVTVNDSIPVELGVKFTADAGGLITGLRFYKGPGNTGPHAADLWSSNGTLLATANFANESPSGWQQVNFSTPVAITAGTTYVASYHTNGNYSADTNYFANPLVSGDLTASANGNGVYGYGATDTFPTSTFGASNYWVDVVYTRTAHPPVANNDSGFVVGENGSITIAASALLANDTDPNGLPLSITGVSNPAHGTVSYNANTQQVTFVPTAGYTGPASFSYGIADGQGPGSSATVSLTVTPPAPVANNDGGFVINENGSITIAVSTLLANDTDPNGLPISFTGVSNPLNGTVSYNANTQQITFVPTAGYAGGASFSYSITDADGGVSSATVSLFANDPTKQSIFSVSSTPSTVAVNDPSSLELGVKFTADANGLISGLRFYKGPLNIGTHTADLWSSNGTLLATATFSNETASGWQQVNFASPVAITAGTTYTASYHTSGNYSVSAGYFGSSVVSGDLTAPASGNGVYAYSANSVMPTNTFNGSNYWVDVLYAKSAPPPVANNDSGFVASENGSTTIAASALLANDTSPNGQTLSITDVSNASNGTVSYNANTQTVTFTPNGNYTGTASFSYSIGDTSGGTASATASLLVNDPATSSLFNPTTAPSIAAVNDPSSIEVGVKFTSSENGEITGLRFYKGPNNTGPHVADLWSSNGTLLATATFTNETPSGWQQVNFSSPVAVAAGTTYVASYHTNSGDYSADPNLFATALTNGPLTAPSSSSSGGNGVYAYGSGSLFPTNSFNSTSYGVDAVFKPQLAA
jgi:Domain of unknown function (DUF4082)/Cadherin-like domain/Bacterial Ig domain